MKTRSLALVALAAALALLPATVFAQNSVALAPSTQQVAANQPVAIHVDIAFAQQAIGGGIIVAFNPSGLSFSSFTWHPSFPDDPALRLVCPSAHPACEDFAGPGVLVAFASDGTVNPPIQGAHRVGTLSFVAMNSATLTPREDDSGIAGPFVGTGAFTAPTLNGANVAIPTTVPALSWPATAMLFALILSAARRRERRPRQAIG